MENLEHTMSDLFAQLGLPNSEKEINGFIHQHRPVPDTIALDKANFWNNSQSQFLNEALNEDSDWSELVDQLNTRMRE